MGQTVHILEPMGKGGAQWNPLEPLDPAAADYVEQIDAIVDALVIAGDGKNLFWDESARTLIAGLIDYVVRRDRDDEFVPPVEDTEMEEVNA
jgi:type IV secretory pathway TraG/TraD family ATPase VirD4